MLFKYCVITVKLFTLVLSNQPCDNSTSEGLQCKQTISMPLIDNMHAALKADIDVTEMKKVLGAYINQEIKTGIESAMKALVEDMVAANVKKVNQELTSTVMHQLEENKKASQTELEQKIKQIELNLEQKAMAPRQGCQSGTIGEHAYPEVKFPVSQSVIFNPPFKDTPSVVYGLYLLNSNKHQDVRVRTIISNLSRVGFILNISAFDDTVMYGARVSWMACPQTF